MEFLEIAKSRYSVRDYKSRKVEPEKLEKILLAAHVAPTAANLQPVRLIVVQEDEIFSTSYYDRKPPNLKQSNHRYSQQKI